MNGVRVVEGISGAEEVAWSIEIDVDGACFVIYRVVGGVKGTQESVITV